MDLEGAATALVEALGDLAEGTLRTGGEVIVLETARMPSTAAAALIRY